MTQFAYRVSDSDELFTGGTGEDEELNRPETFAYRIEGTDEILSPADTSTEEPGPEKLTYKISEPPPEKPPWHQAKINLPEWIDKDGWESFVTKMEDSFSHEGEKLRKIGKDPWIVAEGLTEIAQSLPGFFGGLVGAAARIVDDIGTGKYENLNKTYESAANAFQEVSTGMSDQFRIYTPEDPEAAAMVGEVVFAPAEAVILVGHELSESDMVNALPEGIRENVKGFLKFAGDIGGLIAQGKVTHGARGKKTKTPEVAEKLDTTYAEHLASKNLEKAREKIMADYFSVDLKGRQGEFGNKLGDVRAQEQAAARKAEIDAQTAADMAKFNEGPRRVVDPVTEDVPKPKFRSLGDIPGPEKPGLKRVGEWVEENTWEKKPVQTLVDVQAREAAAAKKTPAAEMVKPEAVKSPEERAVPSEKTPTETIEGKGPEREVVPEITPETAAPVKTLDDFVNEVKAKNVSGIKISKKEKVEVGKAPDGKPITETVTGKKDVAKLLRDVDKKRETYKKLLDCLG